MTTRLKHPYWTALILCVTVLFSCLYALSATNTDREEAQRTSAAKAVLQEIEAGRISNGFAFAQRCGQPSRITRIGKDMAMHYPEDGISVLFTRLHPKDATDLTFHISFWSTDVAGHPLDAQKALMTLSCKTN
jgi:hypothetical protein